MSLISQLIRWTTAPLIYWTLGKRAFFLWREAFQMLLPKRLSPVRLFMVFRGAPRLNSRLRTVVATKLVFPNAFPALSHSNGAAIQFEEFLMILDLKSPVASFMEAQKITVRELAEKLGKSTQAVHYYRSCGENVKLSTLRGIAKAYGARVVLRVGKTSRRPNPLRSSVKMSRQ